MSFESLEDNFIKKVNEPIKTDVQSNIDAQKNVKGSVEDKETYEENLTKKQVVGGLAALFQEKIKNSNDPDDSRNNDTVFISTENIRYGDQFKDATNYVDEKDIQKFLPGDVYNDSITEPDLNKGDVEIDQRHSPDNRYDDNLSFEPQIASEKDISPQSSISRSVNADAPYSEEEISNKLAEHTEKKQKKQFSENTWSPENSYKSGPQINTQNIADSESKPTFQETELSEEAYEANIRESNETE